MISIGELFGIFSELSDTNKKILYNFLINEFSKIKSEEYIEFVSLLQDLKEELLYSDNVDKETKKLYFTINDLAIMSGLSLIDIQTILDDNNISPVNPGQNILYYDFDEFQNCINNIDVIMHPKNSYYITTQSVEITKGKPSIFDDFEDWE